MTDSMALEKYAQQILKERALEYVMSRPDLARKVAVSLAHRTSTYPSLNVTGMTKRQKSAYDFILQYRRTNEGVSPSYQEIMEHLGLASKSVVHRIVHNLEARGFISIVPNNSRTIVCRDEWDNMA